MSYSFASPNIIRNSDGALMRSDMSTTAWLEYGAWLDEGNVPTAEEGPWRAILNEVLAEDATEFLIEPSATNLRELVSGTTGTGSLVFNTGPELNDVVIGATGANRAAMLNSANSIPSLMLITNTTITDNTVRVLEAWAKTSGTPAAGLAPIMRFYTNDPTILPGLGLGGIGFERQGNNTTGDFIVRTNNSGTETEKLRLTAGGQLIFGGTGANVRIQARSGDASITAQLFAFNGLGGFVGTLTNHNFFIRTNDLNRMMFDTSGNVVIGGTSPQATLHLSGGARSLRVDNAFTDASNGSWGEFAWIGNVLNIGTNQNGTGVERNVRFHRGGADRFNLIANGTHFIAPIGVNIAPSASFMLRTGGNFSTAAVNNNGTAFQVGAGTITDTNSTGTTGNATVNRFGGHTIAALNALHFTRISTLLLSVPVAGTNVTFGNAFALDINSGGARVEGGVLLIGVTFAALPASPIVGTLATVTNSNTVTWGATIEGGGSNNVLARFNGTNWTVVGI